MASKIEQTIDDIYELLDSCKYATFSKENIIVNKEDIYELLEELRDRTPEEIKMYQQMISNRDSILENARIQSDQMIARAQQLQNQMVDQNEIMMQAYAQAEDIVNQARIEADRMIAQATEQANAFQMNAIQYADDSLTTLQDILSRGINSANDRYNDLIGSLNEVMDRVMANRAQFNQQTGMGQQGMQPGGELPSDDGGDVSDIPAPPPVKPADDGIDII